MKSLHNATVLVLGLGDSGLAMARWCARFGAALRVWDSREAPPQAAALAEQVPGCQMVRGALTVEALAGVALVLKSPGLAPHDERIAALLQRAADAGVPVQGELDLFARALADLNAERGYAPQVLAVTGTNGKTTTTAMAAMLIERSGRRVGVAGNIGPTMLQTLADALDRKPAPVETGEPAASDAGDGADAAERTGASEGPDAPDVPDAPTFESLPEVWVLELSSFQLDRVEGFEPSAGAVLNITQDHLDWHGTLEHYVQAKARVFGSRAVMVVNRDDPLVEALVMAADGGTDAQGTKSEKSAKATKATRSRKPAALARHVVRFGLDAPTQPGDFGLIEANGIAWLVRAREPQETLKRTRMRPTDGAEAHAPAALSIQHLMPADALRVRGRHNAANALAALALATAIDCPLAPMLHGLREYAGEPHRVQHIATLAGIDAFDDSKGTNVGATVAAINGLGADAAPGRLLLIAGGDGKGQDFAPLVDPVRRHVRAVALIGRDAATIERALAPSGVAMVRHDTLQAATRWCFESAQAGDAVLLSPACASLDMFRNYAHRAQVFVAEVHAIVADHGGVAA